VHFRGQAKIGKHPGEIGNSEVPVEYKAEAQMNYPAASYGVSDVFRHAGLDPASRFLLSGFRLS